MPGFESDAAAMRPTVPADDCVDQSPYGRLCGDFANRDRSTAASAEEQQDHAAQRGRDAFGTATRISASLSRRLSAFFGSTHDQAPKAAKFAVLNPGHAGFPKRVERSEGSDTTPTSHDQKVLRTE